MTLPLDTVALASALVGTPWRPRVVASTGSTNADLAALARSGAAEPGDVLIAAHQQAGRGRLARRWEAPAGASWATSVLVAPRRPMPEWGWLPLLVGEGKLCGILCEAVADANPPRAVLGFGINTALTAEQRPVPTATSLLLEGASPDPAPVLAAVLGELAAVLAEWEAGTDPRPAYRELCGTLGREVTVHLPAADVRGTALDVDADGGLVVDTASGPRTFVAGDVEHLRPVG